MRYRTLGGFTPGQSSSQRIESCAGWGTWSSPAPDFAVGEKRQTWDVVVPRFHSRVEKGEVFFNPFLSTLHRIESSSGSAYLIQAKAATNCSGVNKKLRQERNGNHAGAVARTYYTTDSPIPASAISGDIIDDLISEVVSSVRTERGTGGRNMYETVAELDKSVAIPASLAEQLAKTLMARGRKKIVRKVQAVTGGVAGTYLTYRYGIKPLMMDLAYQLEAVRRKAGERYRETTRDSRSHTDTMTRTYNVSDSVLAGTRSFTTGSSVEVRAMSLDEFRASILLDRGFSPKALFQTPWELIPFSFVIDWVTNAGDFVHSFVPDVGFANLGGCVSTRHVTQVDWSVDVGVNPSGLYDLVLPTVGNGRIFYQETRRSTALPMPSLVVRNDFKLANITRLADALALLRKVLIKG